MKVKPVGRTHLLLILTPSEARLLGISACRGCAMLLRTRDPLFRCVNGKGGRFRCRVSPQVFHLDSADDLLDCIARLSRYRHMIRSAALYGGDSGYDLILLPTCRHFFPLRSLATEYSRHTGRTFTDAAFVREHGRLLSEDVLRDMAF